MTTVQCITVKSQDRWQGDRTRFSVHLQYPCEFRVCRLEEAIIPNSFYNFIDIDLTVNDGVADVANLNGIYTAISIAQTMSSQLAGYVTTFNADLQRFVITHGSAFTLTIPDAESARRLGFNNLVTSSVANEIVSDRPPDLQRYKNIFINIRELGLGNLSSDKTSGVAFTFKVPVMYNRGEYILFNENAQFFQNALENQTVTKLMDFEVVLNGDDGQQIDESMVNDWMFSLRIIQHV